MWVGGRQLGQTLDISASPAHAGSGLGGGGSRFKTPGEDEVVPYYEFLWTDEIIEHVAEHDLTPEDFEQVVSSPEDVGASDSSGLPCAWGETADGRFIICVYEDIDGITLLPVTAYEVPRPGESH